MLATHRPRLTARDIGLLFGAVLIAILILTGLTAANIRWSIILPGGGSFYSIWSGVREFLFQHGEPYGVAASARAQQLAYGGDAGPLRDPLRLEVPFFLLPMFFPFALIPDPVMARGVWATAAELALAGTIILCLRTVQWDPPRPSLLAVGLLAFLGVPTIRALVAGSPDFILLFVYFAILAALRNDRDELAGALAALALWRWELGLPFLVMLALRCVRERRWRVWAGFAMALTILLSFSFMLYPGWFMPFLVSSVAILRSAHGVSTQAALALLLPSYSANLSIALTIASLTLMLVEAIGAHTSDSRRLAWAASLTLALTPLLGMRSDVTNLVVLVAALIVIAASGAHRRSAGGWLSAMFLVLILGTPWIIVSRWPTILSPRAEALLFLILPSACVVAMYWTRWWFLRPARTWLDEIRAHR